MIGLMIMGFLVLLGFVLLGRWFVQASPAEVRKVLRWTVIGLLLLTALVLALTGRLAWMIAVFGALIPWLARARFVARIIRNLRAMGRASTGAPSGQSSKVDTRFLSVVLDHDSGRMDGEVREGALAGRQLSGLQLDDLVSLYATCRATDDESARILEAYLDRRFGADWREADGRGGGTDARPSAAMSRAEALSILGLGEGATESEIKAAHHRLIRLVHPDQGGSDYLAARINQAKDFLIGK